MSYCFTVSTSSPTYYGTTISFSFKLDPTSLPKLSSRGENYTEWKSAWAIAFTYAAYSASSTVDSFVQQIPRILGSTDIHEAGKMRRTCRHLGRSSKTHNEFTKRRLKYRVQSVDKFEWDSARAVASFLT